MTAEEWNEALKAELCVFFPHDFQKHPDTDNFMVCTRCGETGWEV